MQTQSSTITIICTWAAAAASKACCRDCACDAAVKGAGGLSAGKANLGGRGIVVNVCISVCICCSDCACDAAVKGAGGFTAGNATPEGRR